jgi:sortase (surface protein transpeptidase)
VFNRLARLHRGDAVRIRHGRHVYVYRVTTVRSYAKARVPSSAYRAARSQRALRLITCGGAFDAATGHYRNNVVVSAVRVK